MLVPDHATRGARDGRGAPFHAPVTGDHVRGEFVDLRARGGGGHEVAALQHADHQMVHARVPHLIGNRERQTEREMD